LKNPVNRLLVIFRWFFGVRAGFPNRGEKGFDKLGKDLVELKRHA
jgi:hypothetical protein